MRSALGSGRHSERGRTSFTTAEAQAAHGGSVKALQGVMRRLRYPQHTGGLGNGATVLSELAEALDPGRLTSLAALSPLPWAQRLGYLLDHVGAHDKTHELADWVDASSAAPCALDPGVSPAAARQMPAGGSW